jgi:CheY-like chemotaxis protein
MQSAHETAQDIVERHGDLALAYIEDHLSTARAHSDWAALGSWREIGSNVVRLLARRATRQSDVGAPSPATTKQRRSLRVLIIEDDVAVAELCRRILDDEGYDCTVTHDLASAREAIAVNGADLLLADVELPGGTTSRSLVANARRAGISILFMSGDYVALRQLAEDQIPHLRKPFRLAELVARVATALIGLPGSVLVL